MLWHMALFGGICCPPPRVKERVLSGREEDFEINRHKRTQLRGPPVSRKVGREEEGLQLRGRPLGQAPSPCGSKQWLVRVLTVTENKKHIDCLTAWHRP